MNRKYYYLISVFILVVIAIIFLVLNRDTGEKLVPLKASVVYSDKKFTITNIDTINFIHADLSIDDHYKLRDYNLQAGETYTVWQSEFTHHNGTHYPDKGNPVQFSIWCDVQDGRNGYYSKKLR